MHLMLWEHENLVDTLSLFSLFVWLTVQSDGCCLLRKRLTFVTTDGSSLAPGAPKKVPPSPDLSTTLFAQEKNIHSNSILQNAEGSRKTFSAETQGVGCFCFSTVTEDLFKLNFYKLFPRACSPLTLARPRTLVFAALLRIIGEREHHDISQNKGSPSG